MDWQGASVNAQGDSYVTQRQESAVPNTHMLYVVVLYIVGNMPLTPCSSAELTWVVDMRMSLQLSQA